VSFQQKKTTKKDEIIFPQQNYQNSSQNDFVNRLNQENQTISFYPKVNTQDFVSPQRNDQTFYPSMNQQNHFQTSNQETQPNFYPNLQSTSYYYSQSNTPIDSNKQQHSQETIHQNFIP